MAIFEETEKIMLKVIENFKKPQIALSLLNKKKDGYLPFLDFKTYHKAIEIVWYWYKHRYINQMNTRECSEIILCIYVKCIHKGAKTTK